MIGRLTRGTRGLCDDAVAEFDAMEPGLEALDPF
jgi:hypothetical protein